MKKSLIVSCVLALTVGLTGWLWAKDEPGALPEGTQPIAVVSLAGYDEILSDIGFIGSISNNPGLDQNLEGMLKLFTQGQGVNGLDRKRPWGVVLSTDGVDFQPLMFLPVISAKQLLTSLAPVLGEPRDAGDGVTEISINGQKISVKEQGGWAFLSPKAEMLKTLPGDPLKLLDGLNKQYDVAIRLYAQAIPQVYRDFALEQVKSGAQAQLQKEDNESEEDFALRKALAEDQLAQMESLFKETDQLTIGWTVDQSGKSTYLDFQLTAVPGSSLANEMAMMSDASSAYAGFLLPDGAVTMNVMSKISPERIKRTQSAIKAFRAKAMTKIDEDTKDDATKAALKEVAGGLLDVLGSTVASGKMDMAGAVMLSGSPQFIGGGDVSDTSKLEGSLKKLASLAASQPKAPSVTLNAETHAGVKFHKVSIPVPANEKDAQKIFGPQLDIAIGIGPKSVYIAAGKDSLSVLKKVLDVAGSAPRPVQPLQIVVSLESIMKFAKLADPDNQMLPMLAEELAKTPGKDHLIIAAKPVKNGASYRISLEEGVLKLLGQASKVAAGGAGVQGLQ